MFWYIQCVWRQQMSSTSNRSYLFWVIYGQKVSAQTTWSPWTVIKQVFYSLFLAVKCWTEKCRWTLTQISLTHGQCWSAGCLLDQHYHFTAITKIKFIFKIRVLTYCSLEKHEQVQIVCVFLGNKTESGKSLVISDFVLLNYRKDKSFISRTC